jgi:uncharacterized membrane-anchored protein YitT (DUF2179 family)
MKKLRDLHLTKEKVLEESKNAFLVLLGCALMAFADAVFIVPCNIVNGGVESMGILINYYLEPTLSMNVTDIAVGIIQAVFWVIGLFVLGKRFSFYTLLGTAAFPAFYSLMFRFHLENAIGIDQMYVANSVTAADGTVSYTLAIVMLAGLFGGALDGIGEGLTYLGNGSTGGFDVISFIIAKFSDMKQDVSAFVLDSSLIFIGIICMKDWALGLVGILSAFANSLAIQFMYIHTNSFIIADIISDKQEEIQSFIATELKHPTTLIDTTGGATGQKRKMIRVVIYQVETSQLRAYIAAIDPKAFVSFTTAKTINGRGFDPFVLNAKSKERLLNKYRPKKKAALKAAETTNAVSSPKPAAPVKEDPAKAPVSAEKPSTPSEKK